MVVFVFCIALFFVAVQAIYGFIGAEDHLKRVPGGKVRHLTQVLFSDKNWCHWHRFRVPVSLLLKLAIDVKYLLKRTALLFCFGFRRVLWHEDSAD